MPAGAHPSIARYAAGCSSPCAIRSGKDVAEGGTEGVGVGNQLI